MTVCSQYNQSRRAHDIVKKRLCLTFISKDHIVY